VLKSRPTSSEVIIIKTLTAAVATMETTDIRYKVADVATATEGQEEMATIATDHPEMGEKPFNRVHPMGVIYSASVKECAGYLATGGRDASQL